ncbi:MAG TPA: hypothetical protein VFI54_24470 [Solirubrobacteraceae bacterium]|nr:hypothetical protein [Solirubrobacteraceae bacterium]
MCRARHTVETHLTHVFQKLGVATRAELTTRFRSPEPPQHLGAAHEERLAAALTTHDG